MPGDGVEVIASSETDRSVSRWPLFLKRVGNDVLGVGPQPQIVGDDLNDVADQLIAQHEERTNAA